jgi:hypothetical protein
LRKLHQDGGLSAVSAGEEVVPASELSDALKQIRELQRMLGKKTMEVEILKRWSMAEKNGLRARHHCRGRPVKVCDALGVARSNVAKLARPGLAGRARGRKRMTWTWSVKSACSADLPSYGYRRVWGLLRSEREARCAASVNVKRVYRVMRVHGLLLQRRAATSPERRHDGKVAVAKSNQRWCSDGFEFRCDNGELLRVTFALDCCDREAMSWAATTGGTVAMWCAT